MRPPLVLRLLRSVFRLSFLLSFCVLAACVGKRQDHPVGGIQVKIPILTDGTYQFQVVDLLSVDDLVELKGWAARFLISPNQVDNKLQGYSPKIRTVRNADGVYIATDELSLQLLTIYYHLEKLGMMDELAGAKEVNAWPRTVAVNVNYISKNSGGSRTENNALYSGELDALLFVPYTESALPIMINGGIIGHEHFHSLFHKLFVQPLGDKYPGGSKVTLHQDQEMKLAFGITAPEMPSTISAPEAPPLIAVPDAPPVIAAPQAPPVIVPPPAEPEVERTPRSDSHGRGSPRDQSQGSDSFGQKNIVGTDDYHSYLLRGLNEGLADYWGWLYSGDTDFVGLSLPQFSSKRKLEGRDEIPSDYCFSLSLTYDQKRDPENPGPVAKAYKYGSSVAKNLKAFSKDYQKKRSLSTVQMRAQMGSAVLRSIVVLKEAYLNIYNTNQQSFDATNATVVKKTLSTNQFFEILSTQIDNLSTEEVSTLKPVPSSDGQARILCK